MDRLSNIDPGVFDNTADRLERDGWWNGRTSSQGNETCVGLGIGTEVDKLRNTEYADVDIESVIRPIDHVRAFMEFLGIEAPHSNGWYHTAYNWNDRQTTIDRVVSALRGCAEYYRLQQEER